MRASNLGKTPARLIRWRQDSTRELDWWIVWHDYTRTPPAKRRVKCRAQGATTREQRRALLDRYLEIEAASKTDAAVEARDEREHGATGFDLPLATALARYEAHLHEQRSARQRAGAARVGLAESSAREAWDSATLLVRYLVDTGNERQATGELTREQLAGWVRWLATEPGRRGPRGPATIAKHCRHVKAMLRWLDALRPRLLRDAPHLLRGLKPPRQKRPAPQAIEPKMLAAFLRAALDREARTTATVRRHKGDDGPAEEYEQGIPQSDTPVSRLFVLLAATGCRLGEALALRWEDVDLERGIIEFADVEKTGDTRRVPMADRYQGEVAPELLPLLRRWRLEAGPWPWVLPTRSGAEPSYSRQGWRQLEAAIGAKCNPQRLRRSWVSFAYACGLSSAYAALLGGHSQAVAQRWYLGQVIERAPGRSMLAAMGLAPLLRSMSSSEVDESTGEVLA